MPGVTRRKRLWRDERERELVDHWAGYLGLSPKTIELYLTTMRRVWAWCEDEGYDAANMPVSAVLEVAETFPWAPYSRARLRSSLKAYWTAIERPNPPLAAVRVPSKPRQRSRAMDEAPAARLANVAAARGDLKGLAVLFGLYVGLRRAEIAGLRWGDFHSDFEWLRVIGKRDKTAELPIHPVLQGALRLHPIDTLDGGWVFRGRRAGTHVCPTTIWGWTRKVVEEAKLGPVGPHILRHTALTTANDVTKDLRAVQEFARHERPETTALYTRVRTKRLVHVMASLDYAAVAAEAEEAS